jgi:hypothetical protein
MFDINSRDRVYELANRIVRQGADITSTYYDWMRAGMAIKGEYGEGGRDLFHLISSNHPDYDAILTDEKYNSILKSNSNKVGIGTLIYMLKQNEL